MINLNIRAEDLADAREQLWRYHQAVVTLMDDAASPREVPPVAQSPRGKPVNASPNPRRKTSRIRGAKPGRGGVGSVQHAVVDWIEGRSGSFRFKELALAVGGNKHGVASAVNRLETRGMVEHVAYGTYQKTKAWMAHPEQSEKEANYRALRQSMDIKPPPDAMPSTVHPRG